MACNDPIGIFDSGVGGLTVARAVLDLLPGEQIRYVGDTAHAPYGPQPAEKVRDHAMALADRLVESGVKILVIACNTATAAGVYQLARERYQVPVVEVIGPAVRRAVAATSAGRIGVIGTQGTCASGAYQAAFAETGAPVSVFVQPCPSFVDFVERGITAGRQITGLAQAYLDPLQYHRIDTLVLGCTHYPLLTPVLSMVLGDQVLLVSSAAETALDVRGELTAAGLLSDATGPVRHEFTATGDLSEFALLADRFLGQTVPVVPAGKLAG